MDTSTTSQTTGIKMEDRKPEVQKEVKTEEDTSDAVAQQATVKKKSMTSFSFCNFLFCCCLFFLTFQTIDVGPNYRICYEIPKTKRRCENLFADSVLLILASLSPHSRL